MYLVTMISLSKVKMTPTIIYHGGAQPVPHPEIRETKFTKDFGFGFYCTKMKAQAQKWCHRKSVRGAISQYEFAPLPGLNYKTFTEDDAWLDFIAACRKGIAHEYDIVEGPMADDQIWDFVDDFLDGNISREEFWAIAQFRHPTHQISFHTTRALQALTFISHDEVLRHG